MGNLSTAPRNTRGKQWYACNFIFRGEKKEKVGLAELSIAEYNVGFSKLIAQKHFKPEDRIRMVKHINQVNEDATTYDWGSVRTWSEGICKAIADRDLKWKDQYAIDRERQRVSQRGSATGGSAGASGGKTCHSLTAELRAANRAPPCRQYNQGSCQFKGDHVLNGFRHLHVCATCIFRHCEYEFHPEYTCSVKASNDKRRNERAGFGSNYNRNQNYSNNTQANKQQGK